MFQSGWGVFLTMRYVQVGMYCNDTYIKAYKKLCIPVILLKRYCLKQNKKLPTFWTHTFVLLHSCLFFPFNDLKIMQLKKLSFSTFLGASH